METATLERLIDDAERIVDVGVRLGRIKNLEVVDALQAAKAAVAGNDATALPIAAARLQKSLNDAVKDIAPITLNDLRSGWTPFPTRPPSRAGTILFGIFSILLLSFAAYTTSLYDRARAIYATTLELQDGHGAEQSTRLFGLLKRNREDVVDSLINGKKDFLYEAFSKALSDLQATNLKYQAYWPTANEVLRDLSFADRVHDWFRFTAVANAENPSNNPAIAQILSDRAKGGSNYGSSPDEPVDKPALPRTASELKDLDIRELLGFYIEDIKEFNSAINVKFDPVRPPDYSDYLVRFRDNVHFLGAWLLPALYGMLGAVIFHMRRLQDPTVPNPSWLRFAYRIVLGGFAGIIVVWVWTPAPGKTSQPEFATLTSFGVAFLVGFSTDVFFQALDRLVNYASQAIGPHGA